MECGRDMFGGVDRACSAAEEMVAISCTAEDGVRVERVGSVRATVVLGGSMSAGAGASVHAETADRVSVVVRCREWFASFSFPPRFGMVVTVERLGDLTVKGVTAGEWDFTMRCTRRMRAGDR